MEIKAAVGIIKDYFVGMPVRVVSRNHPVTGADKIKVEKREGVAADSAGVVAEWAGRGDGHIKAGDISLFSG